MLDVDPRAASEVALLSYESLSAAARLTKPFLLVHGANCALPEQAERHFAVVPTHDKLHRRWTWGAS
ncbi:hypothetical protein [Actinomadura logoneensis]|uniref:hypothetical protein n=1 Tax=Actinomadura logoneensis TaxID=2293572 RepID=UPI0011C14F71|nr:hypothetical protein [Actinomadura logoneensis]